MRLKYFPLNATGLIGYSCMDKTTINATVSICKCNQGFDNFRIEAGFKFNAFVLAGDNEFI